MGAAELPIASEDSWHLFSSRCANRTRRFDVTGADAGANRADRRANDPLGPHTKQRPRAYDVWPLLRAQVFQPGSNVPFRRSAILSPPWSAGSDVRSLTWAGISPQSWQSPRSPCWSAGAWCGVRTMPRRD